MATSSEVDRPLFTVQGDAVDGEQPYISYDLRLIDLEIKIQRRVNEIFFPTPKTGDELLNKLFLDYMAGYMDRGEWEKIRPLVPRAMAKYTKKVSRRR